MWLLESGGSVLNGKRLWLRPGKVYLFGRTLAEAGHLAISHKTISRKHLTITVDPVLEDDARRPTSRSKITLEDLKTKTGTSVNGTRIKGEAVVLGQDENEVLLGSCPDVFRIVWQPVVLSFSFTSRELQADPLSQLVDLAQLDIRLTTDYSSHTTHVVSKKRNTSKGLQALINGKYIVSDTFIEAIRRGAVRPPGEDSQEPYGLEADFDANWPNALEYLPPRGGEPVERPATAYAPDPRRQDVFDGYTFIFYDRNQFDNLMGPITSGKGKALHKTVNPGETAVDDFVRAVKAEAGEKGLGSFDDGSEGKGVVVVRFLPNKGEHVIWYEEFFKAVSLRLDHRPIEQNEFLEAILNKDASMLRRPLQVAPTQESDPEESPTRRTRAPSSRMEVDEPEQPSRPKPEPQPAPRRTRAAAANRRRFGGFDASDSSDDDKGTGPLPIQSNTAASPSPNDGLFVTSHSQIRTETPEEEQRAGRQTQKKRPAPSTAEDDLIDEIAPTAAAVKRRRIAAGEDPVPRPAVSRASTDAVDSTAEAMKGKRVKREINILEVARRQREELEARALAEKEDLANLPPDVDLAEIRRLNIVEEMEVRAIPTKRVGAEDDQSDRWDPKWNGRKNFKRFRQRGVATGRPVAKVIVALDEVKRKDYGMNDEYWLEGESQHRKKDKDGTQGSGSGATGTRNQQARLQADTLPRRGARIIISDDDEDESGPELSEILNHRAPATSNRAARVGSATQSQATRPSEPTRHTQAKRPAAVPPTKELPAKKPRTTRQMIESRDSDDSEDELKFRFGKRR